MEEEGEMRWCVKKVETEIETPVYGLSKGKQRGRGGEENTVNNGTSVKMPGKLEGRESGGVRGEEEGRGGTSCGKKVGSEAQTNSIFVV